MIATRLLSALAAASLLSMASAATPTVSSSSSVVSIPTPTASVALNAMTDIGCFNTSAPLEDHGSYLFQSAGNCQAICVLLGKPVLGLVDGSNCWCGDLVPAKDSQISNSTCNTPCNGINTLFCGGNGVWWIKLTGLNHNQIPNYDPASAPSGAASTAVRATGVASTVVVTAADSATGKPQQNNSSPSKAGIAAGVVVGVVGLAAIIAGVVFYLRHRRRRQVEEEYRRQAAVNQFVAGGKLHTSNSSMTDSRLDPAFMARRASNGTIADNEDYSRRILKVTNA